MRQVKKVNYYFTVLLLMTVSASSYAKKYHYPIEVVAGMANLIVVGEIQSFTSDTYQFKINQTVKGQPTDLIQVQMFKEWTCDIRMKKVAKGQKLLLFLKKDGDAYEIINGSTGEIFIEKDIVLRIFNKLEPSIEELVTALKVVTSTFKLKNENYQPTDEIVFSQLKPDEDIIQLSKTSKLTTWFFDKIKQYKTENISSLPLALTHQSTPCVFGENNQQDPTLIGKWKLIKIDNKTISSKKKYYLEFSKSKIQFNTTKNTCAITQWKTKEGIIEYETKAVECTELCCDDDFSKTLQYNGAYSVLELNLLTISNNNNTYYFKRN